MNVGPACGGSEGVGVWSLPRWAGGTITGIQFAKVADAGRYRRGLDPATA